MATDNASVDTLSTSLTTGEAAEACGVSARTVLRWVKDGHLRAFATPGGHQRVSRRELVRFLRTRGADVPKQLLPASRRVVIADDSPAFCRAVQRRLTVKHPGVVVEAVRDGFAAGAAVQRLRPDLLLLDIVMPGLDGVAACAHIRSQPELDGVAVVIVSGALTPALCTELRELGADRCVPKPVTIDQIDQLLEHYLGDAETSGRDGAAR